MLKLCLSLISIVTFLNGCFSATPPFLVHDSGDTGGMFAEFASVLGGLKSYEQGDLSGIKIHFDKGCYLDLSYGPNWWEYYFEPIDIGNHKAKKKNCSLEHYLQLANIGFALTRIEAFHLIQKYIHIKPEIENEVQGFVETHFRNYFVIGIHYRGTDKINEYARIPYSKAYAKLREQLDQLSKIHKQKIKVYVATDEQQFVEYLQKRIPDLIISNDFVRALDKSTALHYSTNLFSNNYQKGREALVDCLLLSKCYVLLRSYGSCFSWAPTLFNPNQECILY